jgi:hypothetical protein
MLRFAELLLLLSPFLLFALWRVAAFAGWPSTRIVAASFAALLLVLASLLWFSHEGALPTGSTYVPAQFQNGRIVPPDGASRGAAPP